MDPGVESARQAIQQLLRSIHVAIEEVAANAAAARSALPPIGDDILAAIDFAERTKTIALETEAVAAEAVLDGLEADNASAIARAATISKASSLPTKNVEPSYLSIVKAPSGRAVAAPRGVHPAHVELDATHGFVQPGRNLTLRLSLTGAYPSRLPEELEVATAELSQVGLYVGGIVNHAVYRVVVCM